MARTDHPELEQLFRQESGRAIALTTNAAQVRFLRERRDHLQPSD
ncbi:MAG TPA: hypothetical protein VIJ47_10245 [Acidimicrobiales bacterium]